MAKTAVIEKLNRKALDGKKVTKAQAKVTAPALKAKAEKKAPAKKEGPSPETRLHRQLLIAVQGIDQYGSVEQKQQAVASLAPIAVKVIAQGEKMAEKEVSEYLANPPSRFLPTGYKNLREHGTPVKDALH